MAKKSLSKSQKAALRFLNSNVTGGYEKLSSLGANGKTTDFLRMNGLIRNVEQRKSYPKIWEITDLGRDALKSGVVEIKS